MSKQTIKPPPPADDQIRSIMIKYFFQRNKRATSIHGKKTGAAARISIIRADLKASHGLTGQQVVSNLTYLMSQGWVEDRPVSKSFTTGQGTVMPATTPHYIITAVGIDKVGGPSEFTRDRFQGIKIEATGQNIITLGDGNQVNAHYQQIGEALAQLRDALKKSRTITEDDKVNAVADIHSIHDQLAKPQPNKTVIGALWENVEKIAAVAGLADLALKVAPAIHQLLSSH
jgi:hypothetical protein